MAIQLGENNYGKQRVRLLQVVRQDNRHDIKELTLGIRFAGDFEAAHNKGDNRNILPTDTMKNTVYALARKYPIETTENFCLHLARHFLEHNPPVSRVRVDASETLWSRLPFGGKSHGYAFTRSNEEKRTAVVIGTTEKKTVGAGIEGLAVLKTAQSAFEGFLRDEYTTLKEDRNRILSTLVRANWIYRGEETEFGTVWHAIRQMMLETFAEHDSQSLQQTLFAMGEAVLSNFDGVREIRLSLPNKHYNLVDLSPFHLDNPGVVFLPTNVPHGLIEATLRKD